jgi:hypothetical protein
MAINAANAEPVALLLMFINLRTLKIGS